MLVSVGLDVFVAFARRARERGSRLALRSPSPLLTRVLDVTGSEDLFEIDLTASEDHAAI